MQSRWVETADLCAARIQSRACIRSGLQLNGINVTIALSARCTASILGPQRALPRRCCRHAAAAAAALAACAFNLQMRPLACSRAHPQSPHAQGMNVAKGGWYTEVGSMWPGQGLSLQVKEVLHRGRSKFQVGRASSGAPLLL